MTTFCWLPPDSEPTGMSVPSVRDGEQLDHLVDRRALGARGR